MVNPTSHHPHLLETIAADRCVLLDGGTATEIPRFDDADASLDEGAWGTRALVEAPESVLAVHRSYARLGCDVISTNTWGLPNALQQDGPKLWHSTRPVHWMDIARRGVRLARQALESEGRTTQCAVAFSLNAALDSPEGAETTQLLSRVFTDDPPDLILFETLSLIRPSLYRITQALLDTGLPVWLSFRRCRHGLCGVFGQHWGGPEGDAFGRAARRFEDMGIAALLVNCIPPDHVDGMISYLRDFTDLPLGVYPNLGYYTNQGWRFDPGVGGDEYADMALRWRAEGAQIIGGCCGVGPDHINAAQTRLQHTPRGNQTRPQPLPSNLHQPQDPTTTTKPWTDHRNRRLYPLDFPKLKCEPGVFAPAGSSLMTWKYLFQKCIGAHQRCLDAGCGSGILAVQLALNGAAHVHAIDLDERAVRNTLNNAFLNDVADRVSASTADLYAWVPQERYEVIVARLWQTPGDPFQQIPGHQPADYWGRGLLDKFIAKLPQALAPEGVAYLVHFSVLSQVQTEAILQQAGLEARVVDYTLSPFSSWFMDSLAQIQRVEELSDAYHLNFGGPHVMIAYLLEVRHRAHGEPSAGDARAGPRPDVAPEN